MKLLTQMLSVGLVSWTPDRFLEGEDHNTRLILFYSPSLLAVMGKDIKKNY